MNKCMKKLGNGQSQEALKMYEGSSIKRICIFAYGMIIHLDRTHPVSCCALISPDKEIIYSHQGICVGC